MELLSGLGFSWGVRVLEFWTLNWVEGFRVFGAFGHFKVSGVGVRALGSGLRAFISTLSAAHKKTVYLYSSRLPENPP